MATDYSTRVFLCAHCKKPFFRPTRRSRYCTPECRQAAGNLKLLCRIAERHVETERILGRKPYVYRPRKIKVPKIEPTSIEAAKRRAEERNRWAAIQESIVTELNKIKLASGCVDCGYKGHPTALQFDHVRGTKIKAVSQFMNLEAALAEVEKCEVRCAVCHSIKTWKWKQEIRKERIARDLTILAASDTQTLS